MGIGGCGTADAIGLYDKLKAVCPDVAWHWKEEDQLAARMRAMTTDAYVCSANAIAETGEIVNIDGHGEQNRRHNLRPQAPVHSRRERTRCVPTWSRRYTVPRNVAARRFARAAWAMNTPCTRSEELKCYDCSAAERVCCAMTILMHKMMGMDKCELILIDQDLGM